MDTSTDRVKEWRQKKKQEGGKAVHVVFDKDTTELFDELRNHFKGYTYPEIFSLALESLKEKIANEETVATTSNQDPNSLASMNERIAVLEDDFKALLESFASIAKRLDKLGEINVASVNIPAAIAGIECDGAATRMDGLPLYLQKLIDPPEGVLPDREILKMIFDSLRKVIK